MSDSTPRLRMFAGPNGSGKTTIKVFIQKPPSWFGMYINPDDLELSIRRTGILDLVQFGLTTSTDEIRNHFVSSSFLQTHNMHSAAEGIVCRDGLINFTSLTFNSYYASVLADFLRRKSLEIGQSFTFETVMSAPDKVHLLKEAQARGFRTYLYFIATEDPAINIARVQKRVAEGGHDVPKSKIIARYYRSISLLRNALQNTDRAYLFDTSKEEPWYFAEVSEGRKLELKGDEYPNWFGPTWSSFDSESPHL